MIALPTVILAFFYGQSRIFFAMARDGLLPPTLARVSGRGTPVRITIFTAVVVAVLAGLFPLADIAALANAGTLTAFIAVCAAMLVMRRRAPDAPRRFTTPLPWVGRASSAILGCALSVLQPAGEDPDLFPDLERRSAIVLYMVYGSPRAERARAGAPDQPPRLLAELVDRQPAPLRRPGRLVALAELARSWGRSRSVGGDVRSGLGEAADVERLVRTRARSGRRATS